MTKWTPKEDDFLRAHYAQDGVKYCADHLGRTDLQQLRNHAYYLGLSLPKGQLIDKEWCRRHLNEIRYLSPWTKRFNFGDPEKRTCYDRRDGVEAQFDDEIAYREELYNVKKSIHTHNLKGVRLA